MNGLRFTALLLMALLAACVAPPAEPEEPEPYPRIDVHGHIFQAAPEYGALLKRLNLIVLSTLFVCCACPSINFGL